MSNTHLMRKMESMLTGTSYSRHVSTIKFYKYVRKTDAKFTNENVQVILKLVGKLVTPDHLGCSRCGEHSFVTFCASCYKEFEKGDKIVCVDYCKYGEHTYSHRHKICPARLMKPDWEAA